MRDGLPTNLPMTANMMTVDVEDYFQVSGFESVVPRETWSGYESRVEANTDRVLELLADAGVTGTFFVLGWVAEHYPQIVKRIASQGHALASHSYWHRLVYQMTPQEFREDVRRAKGVIEAAGGSPVRGFRAPSFSIVERSLWALDVLIEEGYAYDASIFPIRHDRYGIPTAPREARTIRRSAGSLIEVPATAVRTYGAALPLGGGYFRLMPYAWTRWALRRMNERDRQPAMFYIHPWEFDPAQPRLRAPLVSRLRHYNQIGRTTARFRQLLKDFRFGSIEDVVLRSPAPAVAVL
jgi:polysaccharide deacetylase family protein (PEP-CTERM system associated)